MREAEGHTTNYLPAALLFDMDGTLTEPVLDFPLIKQEMGIGSRPILEALAELDGPARSAAEEVLHRHEERAARESSLNHGCATLLDWVRHARLKTALITRNSRRSVAAVLERHRLAFDVLITREDGRFKPDPQPLRLACDRLGVRSDDAWMIGDASYDCMAGLAAGVRTVWISHGNARDFDAAPWKTVRDLPELLEFLRSAQ